MGGASRRQRRAGCPAPTAQAALVVSGLRSAGTQGRGAAATPVQDGGDEKARAGKGLRRRNGPSVDRVPAARAWPRTTPQPAPAASAISATPPFVMRTLYGDKVKIISALRNPIDRLETSFWLRARYPNQNGKSPDGLRSYVKGRRAAFDRLRGGARRAALRLPLRADRLRVLGRLLPLRPVHPRPVLAVCGGLARGLWQEPPRAPRRRCHRPARPHAAARLALPGRPAADGRRRRVVVADVVVRLAAREGSADADAQRHAQPPPPSTARTT